MSSAAVECLPIAVEVRGDFRPRAAHWFDPSSDPRWNRFLQRHPNASLFHSSAWLAALKKTYGYEAIACTTCESEAELTTAIVFCRVKSWLTGKRLVSLPFSDHCEPLVDFAEQMDVLTEALEKELGESKWNYVEIRPLISSGFVTSMCATSIPYSFHKLDLEPELNVLFRNCHRSSVQRKIRRAEREGLEYREGRSLEFLDHFYRLFLLSRRRHKLPPQPKTWFASLMDCFGKDLKIRLAFKGDRPIAAIMTIAYKDTLAYKYAGSDSRFNNMGGIHLLIWKAIQDAKASGLQYLDFGRTDADQENLITFKNRWGAAQSVMTYLRYGNSKRSTHAFDLSATRWKAKAAKYVLSHTPAVIVSKIGQLLYGHVG